MIVRVAQGLGAGEALDVRTSFDLVNVRFFDVSMNWIQNYLQRNIGLLYLVSYIFLTCVPY